MRLYLLPLFLLSAIWGSSYMFIKVAVRAFAPATLVEVRLLLAAALLLGYVAARGGVRRLRPALVPGLALGAGGMALPYFLISWGETHIPSGVAGVGTSSVPIFVALLALRFAPEERSRGVKLFGLAVGLGGVAVVAGLHPRGGWWAVAGTLAVVAASLCYALGSLYTQRRLVVGSVELATASVVAGAVVMLPFAAASLPHGHLGWKTIGAAVVLGLVATGGAQLLSNWLIGAHGSARAMLVNYLIPGFALLYGVGILGEPLTTGEVAGLALILVGVALASGTIRRPSGAIVEA